MLVPDAVVVYRIFGISLDALFALIRDVATAAVIFLIVRTPFKRKYHWAFLALFVAILFGGFGALAAQLTTYSASQAYSYYELLAPVGGDFPYLLVFQFVVLFVSPKVSTWQKCVLIAGYAWVAATVWAPIALGDMSFIYTTPHLSSFGWTLALVPTRLIWTRTV
jgi:hypothetical protein